MDQAQLCISGSGVSRMPSGGSRIIITMHVGEKPAYRGRKLLAIGTILAVFGVAACLLAYYREGTRYAQAQEVTPAARESGAWLWTSVFQITPADRDAIIATAKKNSIDTIYLRVDYYLAVLYTENPTERAKYESQFDAAVETFIQAAHESGIAVDAEGGAPNWAEDGQTDQASTVVEFVKEFNATHTAKFRGFQYDVEPYLLDRYAANKQDVLKKFLDLISTSVNELKGSDLQFSVVIPDFYDASAASTPQFSYAGKTGYTYDHLLSILAQRPGSAVIVMAYRDHAEGQDGAIAIAKGEVSEAEGSQTRVVVALEVGDVDAPGISFYGEQKNEYLAAMQQIQGAFASTTSYGGTATDDIESLKNL